MEKDHVVHTVLMKKACHGKQQCSGAQTAETKGKPQNSWYHLIFTTSMLSEYNHAKDSTRIDKR